MHGISSYEWAVGTTPGGEDIQPLTSDGVVPGSDPDVPGNRIRLLDILLLVKLTLTNDVLGINVCIKLKDHCDAIQFQVKISFFLLILCVQNLT